MARSSQPVGSAVLLVEDDATFLYALSRALRQSGYLVHAVQDGTQALHVVETQTLDVVVTDVRLRGTSGLGVLQAVKERLPAVEVVVITGSADLSLALDCLRAGAFDFIPKPFEMVQLESAIARAVERRRLRETTSLFEASQHLLRVEEPRDLVKRIVDVMQRAMGAHDASLLLPGADGQLDVAYGTSVPEGPLGPSQVAQRVAEDRRPLILNGPLGAHPKFAGLRALYQRDGSSIVVPMWTKDRLVGVLNVSRRANAPPFRDSDLERAGIISSQALLALENARLMRETVMTERLAAMGELVAGVSHEINNPVSFVLSNLRYVIDVLEHSDLASAIQGTDSLAEVRAAAADALDGAERIRQLARDLTGMARGESSPEGVVDLEAPLRAALRVSAAALKAFKAVELDLQPGVMVRGSSGRLAQVFTNLFVNAAHAVRDLSIDRRTMRIRIWAHNSVAHVVVQDQGEGIPPSLHKRIFEPFFTTKAAGEGTGLGLSLSRDIITGLGGELAVQSTVGQGTAFEIRLPALSGPSD